MGQVAIRNPRSYLFYMMHQVDSIRNPSNKEAILNGTLLVTIYWSCLAFELTRWSERLTWPCFIYYLLCRWGIYSVLGFGGGIWLCWALRDGISSCLRFGEWDSAGMTYWMGVVEFNWLTYWVSIVGLIPSWALALGMGWNPILALALGNLWMTCLGVVGKMEQCWDYFHYFMSIPELIDILDWVSVWEWAIERLNFVFHFSYLWDYCFTCRLGYHLPKHNKHPITYLGTSYIDWLNRQARSHVVTYLY